MAVIDSGSSTAGKANVSATYELQVVTPQSPDNAGVVVVYNENDDGTFRSNE